MATITQAAQSVANDLVALVNAAQAGVSYSAGQTIGFDSSRLAIGVTSDGVPILGPNAASYPHYGIPGPVAGGYYHRSRDLDDFNPHLADGWTASGDGSYAVAGQDAQDGVVRITTDTTDGNHGQIRRPFESWMLTSGDILAFGCRVRMDEVTESGLLVGLAPATADIFAEHAATTLTDGVFFYKADDSTSIQLVTIKNSTPTANTVTTAAAATWVWLEFLFNGTIVVPFVNRVAGTAHSSNIVDDELLTPHLCVQTGKTGAVYVEADVVGVEALRAAA